MDIPEDDSQFLAGLVKGSRQKPHSVSWRDRDGSERVTVLSPAEAARLGELSGRLRVSKAEVLRQAAHVPAARSAPRAGGKPLDPAGG
jgi:hypothetical protein